MNSLNATGRVGADAELRYTEKGTAICQFSFALQDGYGDNRVTSWLRCSVFGNKAEKVQPLIRKGSLVAISGSIRNVELPNKDGVKQSKLECRIVDVTLLDKRADGDNLKPASEPKKADGFQPDPFADEDLDSIPF
jgi:single-strand DNA-binding protein